MAYIQMALPLPKPGLNRSISIAGGNLGVCTDLSQESAHKRVSSLSQETLGDLGGPGQEGVYQRATALGGLLPRVRGGLR